MEFKIERKSQFHVVGVSKRVPIQFEDVNHSIVELAQSITPQQRQEMHQLADLYPETALNVSFDFDEGYLEEQGSLTHMIGFATSIQNPYGDLEQITIEDSLWAVFPNTGPFPQTLQETMAKTYAEWLPTSGYELVDLPSISFTNHEDDSLNVYSEVWVPVKEKTTS